MKAFALGLEICEVNYSNVPYSFSSVDSWADGEYSLHNNVYPYGFFGIGFNKNQISSQVSSKKRDNFEIK